MNPMTAKAIVMPSLPVITITAPTLPPMNAEPLTSPLLNLESDEYQITGSTCPRPVRSFHRYISTHDFPITSPSPPSSVSKPIPQLSSDNFEATEFENSLLQPLTTHLKLIHPNTPKEIVTFIATRLISPDRPFGYKGEWKAIGEGEGDDLSMAGMWMEARKGCEQKCDGCGKELDRRLENMYEVAKESWKRLDEIVPSGGRN